MGVTTIRREGLLHVSVSEAYAVVADVERYPEFLHEISSVRISGDVVTMIVKLGPINVTWRQRVTFVPDRAIHIRLIDGPFKVLDVDWIFEEDPQGTWLEHRTRFEISLPIPGISGIVGKALEANTEKTIDAFRRRIAALGSAQRGRHPHLQAPASS